MCLTLRRWEIRPPFRGVRLAVPVRPRLPVHRIRSVAGQPLVILRVHRSTPPPLFRPHPVRDAAIGSRPRRGRWLPRHRGGTLDCAARSLAGRDHRGSGRMRLSVPDPSESVEDPLLLTNDSSAGIVRSSGKRTDSPFSIVSLLSFFSNKL